MPIYEYGCQNCNHTMDVLQKIADAPLTKCPECGQPTLKRLISAPRFRLKGQGWYETDFKKDKQRNLHGERDSGAAADAAAAGDKPGAAKDTSADSKPADAKPAGGKSPDKSNNAI